MILIFGGTTEGRMAAQVCDEAGASFFYSTKGEAQDVALQHGVRLSGPMSASDIQSFCQQHAVQCIIDAAHPFASALHQAISLSQVPVIRYQRDFGPRVPGVCYCADYVQAISQMRVAGVSRLLALSGVNTISRLKDFWIHTDTFFRILNRDESREVAAQAGFPVSNLFFFADDNSLPSVDAEMELMKNVQCDAIITKESGPSGGFMAKIEAAQRLGLMVFVIEHPQLPPCHSLVSGPIGLRRAIERLVPDFFPLKTGLTTGTCATAAAKAALLNLMSGSRPTAVDVRLPSGEDISVPVDVDGPAHASVVKEDNDDPDVTKGCRISAHMAWGAEGIQFFGGPGVGTVSLPGLGLPVGGPAINQTPRQMMADEIRRLTSADVDVTISVEGGEEIARRTFNPRLGVVGGISIIGTSGIVYPLSNEAFWRSLRKELQVAFALSAHSVGLASGKMAEEALMDIYPNMRVVHYGNFVGKALQSAAEVGFQSVALGIMIGKAVKLAEGNLDTHSRNVLMNKDFLHDVALRSCPPAVAQKVYDVSMARQLWDFMPQSFFDDIRDLCYEHCKPLFPHGHLQIHIICDTRH